MVDTMNTDASGTANEPDEPAEPEETTGSAESAEPAEPAEPTTEQLDAPSTEKDPGEEPAAPAPESKPGEEVPNHQAVGIGVVGGPLVEPDQPFEPIDEDDPESDRSRNS